MQLKIKNTFNFKGFFFYFPNFINNIDKQNKIYYLKKLI